MWKRPQAEGRALETVGGEGLDAWWSMLQPAGDGGREGPWATGIWKGHSSFWGKYLGSTGWRGQDQMLLRWSRQWRSSLWKILG